MLDSLITDGIEIQHQRSQGYVGAQPLCEKIARQVGEIALDELEVHQALPHVELGGLGGELDNALDALVMDSKAPEAEGLHIAVQRANFLHGLAELLHGNTADVVGPRRALAVLALEDELVAHHRLVRPVVARPALAVIDLVYKGVVGLNIGLRQPVLHDFLDALLFHLDRLLIIHRCRALSSFLRHLSSYSRS